MADDELIVQGDVILVSLPSHCPRGSEQEGVRPAVVLGVPAGPVRFPVIIAAPLTTAEGSWSRENPLLYPSLPDGSGGLPRRSTVLLDQLRSLDVNRVVGYLGTVHRRDVERMRDGLRRLLNF